MTLVCLLRILFSLHVHLLVCDSLFTSLSENLHVRSLIRIVNKRVHVTKIEAHLPIFFLSLTYWQVRNCWTKHSYCTWLSQNIAILSVSLPHSWASVNDCMFATDKSRYFAQSLPRFAKFMIFLANSWTSSTDKYAVRYLSKSFPKLSWELIK